MGNIGGYLGLFLGYSILQLPSMIEIFIKKFKDWHLWLINSQGNTIIEALCPVESKADTLYITNTTGKEKSSFVELDTKLEARLMRIERNQDGSRKFHAHQWLKEAQV